MTAARILANNSKSGSVIQVSSILLTSNGVITSPSSFTTVTDGVNSMLIAFTPKLSNSLIKLEWQIHGVASNADPVAWCAPFKDSNSLYTNESTGMISTYNIGNAWKESYGTGGGTDGNLINTISGHWIDQNNSTNTRVYSIRVKARGGNFFINRSESNNASQGYSTQGRSIMTITEIAS